jgi:hypothetical protein
VHGNDAVEQRGKPERVSSSQAQGELPVFADSEIWVLRPPPGFLRSRAFLYLGPYGQFAKLVDPFDARKVSFEITTGGHSCDTES